MCRHLAYVGPPTDLTQLTLDAPNSLARQCTTAREMSWGRDNLDGWGFAWARDDAPPRSYRTGLALTEDEAGRALLRTTVADRFIVHVRQMTPGSVAEPVNSAPFTDGARRFFTHNGFVADFRAGVREQLLAKVAPSRAAAIRGDTDSEVLFALVLSRLDDGAAPVEAVGAVADVAELYGGRYNVLLWDGDTIVATRWENSLYRFQDEAAMIVSSEPLDDRRWQAVPERTMVVLDRHGVREEGM
jgi:glutamine amidotransferase